MIKIAGLNPVKSGEIWLGDKDVTTLEPEHRQIGIVYQDYALFPHCSVGSNITFGLKMHREKSQQIVSKLDRVVQLFGIEHLLKRSPDTLSGGEKQKVALARAVVTNPEVMLLDEPLGALDPDTRENMQEELKKLHTELGITVLHVTHDFEEAIAMGDRIAVIGEGCLKQVGAPEEIFQHPNSEFVARFVMARNILKGKAARRADGMTAFKTNDTELISDTSFEGNFYASIRPEDIRIVTEQPRENTINCLPARISGFVNKGSVIYVTAELPLTLTCLVTRPTFEAMQLSIGKQVYLTFSPSSVHLFKD